MNKVEKALFELGEMDALAAQDSPVHRVPPLAKLLATVLYIALVVIVVGGILNYVLKKRRKR